VSARGLACIALLFACLGFASAARAEPALEGAVDGRLLVGVSSRYGGAISVDLWAGEGPFRLGGAFGVGALSANDDASSRVFTPIALSAGVMPRDSDRSGPSAVLRLGGYAGAEKDGLILGPYASCALGFRFALGEGASVRLGIDGWLLLMHEGGLFVGPYLGLGF
jgi:hypothetical protein